MRIMLPVPGFRMFRRPAQRRLLLRLQSVCAQIEAGEGQQNRLCQGPEDPGCRAGSPGQGE